MPTEEEYLEEAMKYADGDIPSYIAFLDGIKYVLKCFLHREVKNISKI